MEDLQETNSFHVHRKQARQRQQMQTLDDLIRQFVCTHRTGGGVGKPMVELVDTPETVELMRQGVESPHVHICNQHHEQKLEQLPDNAVDVSLHPTIPLEMGEDVLRQEGLLNV